MKKTYRKIYWSTFHLKFYIKEKFYYLKSNFRKEYGITKFKRDQQLIVSLTSIPSRFDKVSICLESLLEQSLKPDRLILWISNDLCLTDLPKSLLKLMNRGLEIIFCTNIRSYKKIVPTLKLYPDCIIVTADDDLIYSRDWLKDLYDAYQKEPNYIHCHRAHIITKNSSGKIKSYSDWNFNSPNFQGPSMLLFPTSGAGALYPPGSLNNEITNESVFMKICPTADDVWLKAMSLMNGVACKKIKLDSSSLHEIRGTQSISSLREINITLNKNDEQILKVFEYYNLYRYL